MSKFLDFYLEILRIPMSLVESPQGQVLSQLVSTGQLNSQLGWKLFHEYRTWGLLHLLVLSGSQFGAFAMAWQNLIQLGQRLVFGLSSQRLSYFSLLPASVIYLMALGCPPPLFRCALLRLTDQILRPLKFKKGTIIGIIFLLHMSLEYFCPSDSAFLSWLAFFVLLLAHLSFKSYICRSLSITLIMQIAISLQKELDVTAGQMIFACLSNLLCLPLYERILFPCIGFISAGILLFIPLLSFELNLYIFKTFFAPGLALILDLAILPLLVAHTAFRYTFSP